MHLDARKSIDVLFVEDSEEDLMIILRELKKGGLQFNHERVETASALRSALERKSWDIVLCDYSMPDLSGLGALELIRDLGLDVPLIIVSGAIGEETAVETMVHGARDYILKDNITRLIPAIRRELQAFQNRKLQRETESQLLHLQKMDAIGRLAGGIAHDFNNMLAAIGLYCDLGLDDVGENASVRETITEIKRIGDRAAGVTRQLLLFSRKRVAHPKVICLNDLVADVEKMLRRLIGAHISLEVKLARELGHTRIDSAQMEQVIINLAVNARDAMPRGGRITIETSNSELRGDASVGTLPITPGQYVSLKVSDEGSGMDRETLARVFEPFFTTKPVGKGTGLGLSTTYGIIKEAKGTIAVSSVVGSGTEFNLYLPLVEKGDAVPEMELGAFSERRAIETVLLVEDDIQLRDLCAQVLTNAGFTVISAKSAKDALSVCESNHRPIDILLTDVMMPEIEGLDLARRIRSLRKDIRILFMSGYLDDSARDPSLLGDSDANLIEKPFTAGSLVAKVKEVLSRPK